MSKTLIGVYWQSRADDLQLCADRAAAHFRILRELGPGFDQWFHKAMRKPKTPSKAEIGTTDEVRELLKKGINRRDVDKSVIVELGWSLALWNGEFENLESQTNLHCGCMADRVGNRAVVEASRDGEPGFGDEAAIELFKSLIDLWDAETGNVVQTAWNEGRQVREVAEVATYQRRRWPLLLPRNAIRHANGILTLAT